VEGAENKVDDCKFFDGSRRKKPEGGDQKQAALARVTRRKGLLSLRAETGITKGEEKRGCRRCANFLTQEGGERKALERQIGKRGTVRT